MFLFVQAGRADTYTVTSTGDSGGSSTLRQAILDANANPGADVIVFAAVGTMTLTSGLPSITDELTIDGTTAPGYAPGAPTFIIDGDVTVFTCSNPTSLTIKGLDLSKSGAQGGVGFDLYASSGSVTIQNCKVNNRYKGIVCIGNANWTVTDNDLTATGPNFDNPALYFHSVSSGTIAASGNLFGGTGANLALRLYDVSGKIIGDENASPAADIVIKDTDGLTNLEGAGITIYTLNCSNLTFDGLDVSKTTGAQNGEGIYLDNSSGNMAVKSCKVNNRYRGIVCVGNANWTVTGNDLTASGPNYDNPALYFHTVSTGTIAASNNLFGGTGANVALRLHDVSGKIIGDENASPAADIVIKDTDGLTNLEGAGIAIYTRYCSNLTFDGLDVSKTTGAQNGEGIYLENSSGNMTVKNCKVNNRYRGIFCIGNANWTVTGNDLTASGPNYDYPALYFHTVPTGTITASNNLFGGTGANVGLRLHDVSGKIIGDENASPAADIVIKDTDGLTNLTGEGISIYTSYCSNLTFDGLDVSKPTGAQNGDGIHLNNSSGNMTVKNCKANNRYKGIVCLGNANWTVTGNDLTATGLNHENPALYFHTVPTGTITASNNLFGGTGANIALRLHDVSDKIIGDENASPAADIVIKDTDGLTNLTGEGISIYASYCSNLTFDGLDVSKKTTPAAGSGIQFDNCSGTMLLQNLTITKRNYAIVSNSPAADVTVTCSAIYRNTNGVYVNGAQLATVSNNNFKENTSRSVHNASAISVNAENNYWLNGDGSTTPANAVNGFYGNVDADPAFSAAAGCAPAFAAPVRFFVDVDATGANNGTSWANAFTSLQSATSAAFSGDEIWVAEGTYYPTSDGNQGVYFNVQGGVKIYGGFDGTEDDLTDRVLAGNETILSGDIGIVGEKSDNSDLLMAISNASPGTRVDGFTFSSSDNGYTSGALGFGSGTADVANCTFRNNTAYVGGGMHIGNCTVNLSNCVFHDNFGGAGGGAIAANEGTLVATNCIFRSNTGGDSGGAFFTQSTPNAHFTNCLFYGNQVYNYDGAAIFLQAGTATLDHCTVVGNFNRRALSLYGTSTITNSIIWDNPHGGVGGNVTANNSILQDYVDGTGNIYQDPQFANNSDPDGDDDVYGTSDDGLVPGVCSPAIDGAAAPSPTLDLAGNARVDAPAIGVSAADIGVFEQLDVNYPAVIADISLENISALADNGTLCSSDDEFTADVVVTFTNISSTGNLSITSSQLLSTATPVAMGSTTTSTSHTFTGMTFKAVNPTLLTATISDMPCTYSENFDNTPSAGIGEVECTTCGSQWFDDGGPTGNYTQSVSKTFCPQTTSHKAQIDFVSMELEPGFDALFVFDGLNSSANTLAIFNPQFGGLPYGPATITATGENPTGCLTGFFQYSSGNAAGWEAIFKCVRIFDIVVDILTDCNGENTACGTDDTYTADVTVHFASIPSSGMLTLSGADIVGVPPSPVDVTSLTGNSYTFTGLKLRADGQSTNLSAVFTAEPDDVFSKITGTAPEPCSSSKEIIIAVDPFNYTIDKYKTTTWAKVSSVELTFDGYNIDAVNGLALNPINNTYYAIIKTSNTTRRLVTVDIETGVCTDIGNLGGNFSSITFGTDGTLYGVQGSGGNSSLYTIDPATAAKTLKIELNDEEGHILAFNPADGLLYHFSGDGYMEKIDPTYYSVTEISTSGDIWEYAPFGATYAGNGTFYLSNYYQYMYSVTTDGVSTELHSFGEDYQRGFVLGTIPAPPCDISNIESSPFSACDGNGTADVADDTFTADVTVTFAYAPGTGNLTLKRGSTVLATKAATDLACLTEWIFDDVEMSANGLDVVLTAEFSAECAHTSASLGTAPVSCSCTPTTETCNSLDDDCDGSTDEDDANPAALCKNISVAMGASGSVTVAGAQLDNGSSDTNCAGPSILTFAVSPNTFDCDDLGDHTVTLTVSDAAGNSSNCTATVTVLDVLNYAEAPGLRSSADGSAYDKFGWSLDIRGDVSVSGAPEDKVGSITKQGSAYLFGRNTGGAANWGQIKQIKASDGAASDQFGRSVALDGDYAFVGSELDNVGANTDQGSAYIFKKDLGGTDNWGQLKQIKASDGETYEYFGNAIAADNGRVLVGALSEKNGATQNIGAAYLFEKDLGGADNWGQAKKLAASDATANHKFGTSVGISGNYALVGSPGHTNSRGAAYIFKKDQGGTDNWGELKKLGASDPVNGDLFGSSVHLAGDLAIVGAFGKQSLRGYAYIFQKDAGGTDNWGQVARIGAADGAGGNRFGWSVKISGDYAYVGAYVTGNQGAVYVFHKDAGGAGLWGQIAKYVPAGISANDQFGYTLALSGTDLAVGAPLDDVATKTDQGSIYVFSGTNCPGTPRIGTGSGDEKSATSTAERSDFAAPNLVCSPNPFRDELKIEIGNWEIGEASAVFDIQIMDATGRVVVQKTLAPGQKTWFWDSKSAATGLYFVQVSGESGVRVLPVSLVR